MKKQKIVEEKPKVMFEGLTKEKLAEYIENLKTNKPLKYEAKKEELERKLSELE